MGRVHILGDQIDGNFIHSPLVVTRIKVRIILHNVYGIVQAATISKNGINAINNSVLLGFLNYYNPSCVTITSILKLTMGSRAISISVSNILIGGRIILYSLLLLSMHAH